MIISFQCQHDRPLKFKDGAWVTIGGSDHAGDCRPTWRIENGRKVPVKQQMAKIAPRRSAYRAAR
jgi:hypothetical protein